MIALGYMAVRYLRGEDNHQSFIHISRMDNNLKAKLVPGSSRFAAYCVLRDPSGTISNKA